MASSEQKEQKPSPIEIDPRTRFAAERTLLAWIRTGLALMGFGFVVARFGLFLHELDLTRQVAVNHSTGISQGLGISLVILGVSVLLLAARKHRHNLQRLGRGEPLDQGSWPMEVILAILVAAVGLAMVAYLAFLGH